MTFLDYVFVGVILEIIVLFMLSEGRDKEVKE